MQLLGSGLAFCFYLGQQGQALLFNLCLYEYMSRSKKQDLTPKNKKRLLLRFFLIIMFREKRGKDR
jgi:hypothetical protein